MLMTPDRLAALRAERDDLARVAALQAARVNDARATGRRYAAERLTYVEIVTLLSKRGMQEGPFWLLLAADCVDRIAPGAGLTDRAEIVAFLDGVGDVAALL